MGSATALIVLCLGWELWLAPIGQRTLAVKALPLLFVVPGLWRMRLRTYRWVSLLVWLYVGEGLVRATSEGGTGAVLAIWEVAIGIALFVACAMHVRARRRAGTTASP